MLEKKIKYYQYPEERNTYRIVRVKFLLVFIFLQTITLHLYYKMLTALRDIGKYMVSQLL